MTVDDHLHLPFYAGSLEELPISDFEGPFCSPTPEALAKFMFRSNIYSAMSFTEYENDASALEHWYYQMMVTTSTENLPFLTDELTVDQCDEVDRWCIAEKPLRLRALRASATQPDDFIEKYQYKVMAKYGAEEVFHRDGWSLMPTQWLNNNVINYATCYIRYEHFDGNDSAYIIRSHFFTALYNRGKSKPDFSRFKSWSKLIFSERTYHKMKTLIFF